MTGISSEARYSFISQMTGVPTLKLTHILDFSLGFSVCTCDKKQGPLAYIRVLCHSRNEAEKGKVVFF